MEQNKSSPLPDPELKPDVPPEAEKMNILAHVRHQFHPMFVNAHGFADIDGPREYVSLDLRCPLCKHIQPLGPPGVEGTCGKCGIHYKYTAAKGNCFLWIWKPRPKLVIETGSSIEIQRAFEPGHPHDPNKSNVAQSGFIVKESK